MICIVDTSYSCPYEDFFDEGSMTCEECEVCNV